MTEIKLAIDAIKKGGVVAYPTEAIYGLGCDPFNEIAVHKILDVKQRSIDKGLILIASDFSQIKDLIIPSEHMALILKTWPGPNTWVFPATDKVPKWITGQFQGVAIRVTDHPLAKLLCSEFAGPLVSTSANLSSKSPAKTWHALDEKLLEAIDYVVKGPVGGLEKCSSIRDALNLKVLR